MIYVKDFTQNAAVLTQLLKLCPSVRRPCLMISLWYDEQTDVLMMNIRIHTY